MHKWAYFVWIVGFVLAAESLQAMKRVSNSNSSSNNNNNEDSFHPYKRQKFANPTNDVAFKHLFKGDDNEAREITKSFLHAMTGENITSITYKSDAFPELSDTTLAGSERKKQTFLDFVCQDNKTKEQFIMEMQVRHEDFFDERAVFYAAGIYSAQLNRGGPWSSLKRVIALQILDHESKALSQEGDFEKHYKLVDTLHYDPLRAIPSIELRQFELPRIELDALPTGTSAEKAAWLRFFKEAGGKKEIPSDAPQIIQQAYERIVINTWGEDVQREYEIIDAIDVTRYTEVLGQAEAKGLAKGLVEGEAKGLVKGKAEGLVEGKKAIARNMLAKQIAIDVIAQVTGLSVEEVQSLSQS